MGMTSTATFLAARHEGRAIRRLDFRAKTHMREKEIGLDPFDIGLFVRWPIFKMHRGRVHCTGGRLFHLLAGFINFCLPFRERALRVISRTAENEGEQKARLRPVGHAK